MSLKKTLSLLAVLAMIFTVACVPAFAEETNTINEPPVGLSGSGTEEDPFLISSLDDLILFRNSINAGDLTYNYVGAYVALNADIDMSGVNWNVNIGDGCYQVFEGIFDGKNHTISNLTSTETEKISDGFICAGLFGTIYKTTQIKNLIIENATISTGDYPGNNVGVVAGFAYSCEESIENVTVKGDIKIDAPNALGVGTIVGYAYYGSPSIKDCSVDANAGSYINAVTYCGGIVGYGGEVDVIGCSVENLTLTSNSLNGGITGMLFVHTTPGIVDNCSVKNVSINTTHELWGNSAAVAVGALSSEGIIVSNVTSSGVTVNGETSSKLVGSSYTEKPTSVVPVVQAKIGDKYYSTLNAAIKAAKSGDTIDLLTDLSVATSESIEIPAGLNLNVPAGVNLTVNGGSFTADSVNVGGVFDVYGESTLNITTLTGESVDFNNNAIIKDSTIGGGVFVAGKVTFRGNNAFKMIYDYGTLTDYYGTEANMEWTVEEGASVTLLDKSRYGLGYGDNVTVTGSVENALTARESLTDEDMSLSMHGLVAQESKGWNCNSALTVNNAYVKIGDNNSFGNKPGNYGGTYTFDITNSVVDASRITFYEALSKTTFNLTKSDVKMGTFMTNDADSVFNLKDSVVLSTTTTNGTDEGNYNAGALNLYNTKLTYSAPVRNNGTITIDTFSKLTAPKITGSGNIIIDATGYDGSEIILIEADASDVLEKISVTGTANAEVKVEGNVIKLVSKETEEVLPSEVYTLYNYQPLAVPQTIKEQYGYDTGYKVRLYAGIDKLSYKDLGFMVKLVDPAFNYETEWTEFALEKKIVYKQIVVTTGDKTETLTPDMFPIANSGAELNYLFPMNIWVPNGDDGFSAYTYLLVRPFSRAYDGTVVLGEERKTEAIGK